MMQNPAVVQALAHDRAAELRQSAAGRDYSRSPTRRRHVTQAVRCGTGWLLIDLGLRLALPSGATNPLARVQRR